MEKTDMLATSKIIFPPNAVQCPSSITTSYMK